MNTPNEDDSKAARHALWLTTTLNLHYTPNGISCSTDSAYHLHIALEALEDNLSARKVARLLASSRPADSDAAIALTQWWITNLRDDAKVTPWQRLDELAKGTAHPYYEAQLGTLLTDPVTAQRAAAYGLKQIELGAALAQASHETIEVHASRLASITPDVALFMHLQSAHEHNLPALRSAVRAELYRVSPVHLEHWHDQARGHDHCAAIRSDLKVAFTDNLLSLAKTDPADAWQSIEALEYRWNNGRPVIIPRTAAPIQTIFNAYAAAEPRLASYISARDIQAGSSAEARLAALADTQERVSNLEPRAQLLFLAQLHARLMFAPELVRPSREQLLTLHRAYPEAGVTQTLNELAQGDIVLQNHLAPSAAAPVVQLLPKPAMSALSRLRNWFSGSRP